MAKFFTFGVFLSLNFYTDSIRANPVLFFMANDTHVWLYMLRFAYFALRL